MKNKENIIKKLSAELSSKKDTRINIRVTDDLHQKLLEYRDKTGVSISDFIRIAVLNYFENEVNH